LRNINNRFFGPPGVSLHITVPEIYRAIRSSFSTESNHLVLAHPDFGCVFDTTRGGRRFGATASSIYDFSQLNRGL
jgi:hypothetical protein